MFYILINYKYKSRKSSYACKYKDSLFLCTYLYFPTLLYFMTVIRCYVSKKKEKEKEIRINVSICSLSLVIIIFNEEKR